jgi:hypothetical protein
LFAGIIGGVGGIIVAARPLLIPHPTTFIDLAFEFPAMP